MSDIKKTEPMDDDEMEQIIGGTGAKTDGKTIYKCNFCGEEFENKRKLKHHEKSFHKNL